MGYLHCKWVSLDELEKDKAVKARVRRFLDKPSLDSWSEEDYFNPAYTKVSFSNKG